jgi:hypothetical protein
MKQSSYKNLADAQPVKIFTAFTEPDVQVLYSSEPPLVRTQSHTNAAQMLQFYYLRPRLMLYPHIHPCFLTSLFCYGFQIKLIVKTTINFGDLIIDGRITGLLKWILKEQDMMALTGFVWLRVVTNGK